jgi:glutamine amidotransferase
MIVIVDFGMGNLRSLQSKLKMIKVESLVSSNPTEIEQASKLILPGVGHFAKGMQNLEERGLIPVLNRQVLEKKIPVLGICLGMQLLGLSSEEGDAKGLGWVDTKVIRFHFENPKIRVPHVGWNMLSPKKESVLFKGVPVDKKPFYFTHSYHAISGDDSIVGATTDYGYPFVSVVEKENIYGTQFHPEKSRFYGLHMIENFVREV